MNHRLVSILVCLLATPALGDVVYLDDGQTLRGDIKRDDDIYVITAPDGTVTSVPRSRVKRLELTGGQSDPSGAVGRLASLRRTAAGLDNLDQIIARYEQFLDQPSNASVQNDARDELSLWKQRRERGLVKYADQWITPQQRDQLDLDANQAARDALQQLQDNDLSAARTSVQNALNINPSNPLALYLQGHILIGANKIPEARKVLEQLAQILPDHAPTLNNLAYLFWRQNQLPAAALRLDQAMAISPMNQTILDNVAEFLHLIPQSLRNNAVVRKASDRFVEQDKRLQAAMAAHGWYRWGGGWIDKPTFDRLQQQQQAIEQKMASMEQQYNEHQTTIQRIDIDIDANNRAMQQIVANSYYRDPDGRLIQLPLPSIYYRLQTDNQRLTAQRQLEQQKQQSLRQQAQAVKDQLPKPTFSDKILPIGLTGAPPLPEVSTAAPATTQSSTPPLVP